MTTQTHTNPDAGAYRAITDIAPRALGADFPVADAYEPRPTPEATRTAIVDGYKATLDDELAQAQGRLLTLGVHKDGDPVTDRRPYLASDPAGGRSGLARIRPNLEPNDGLTAPGPDVTCHMAAPGAETYRLRSVSSTVTDSAPPPHAAHHQRRSLKTAERVYVPPLRRRLLKGARHVGMPLSQHP
ncbi:hypothetical protein [Nocardia sp. NPDC057440]|uniref:hypothetical protein n=1 Tax=Nocardia sp. NPDC057440 TaxID=3346134 RepID=UPI00366C8ED9